MQELRIGNAAVSGQLFAGITLVVLVCAAAAIGTFPLSASIVTIFLFAGVHNVMEFRYFIARMPVRWGRSRTYYSVGIGGVLVLTAAYLAIYFLSGRWLWSAAGFTIAVSIWNTALVLWVGLLIHLRGRQRPRSDWSWAYAAALVLAAAAWLVPEYWSLALVYIHPFVAMWFLERQVRRTRPEWLGGYHLCLAAIPLFVAALYAVFGSMPDLPEDTNLFWRITTHAGSGILAGVSSHFLVATHVFLETIHYFVWILIIPLVDRRAIPWNIKEIPLAEPGKGFPRVVLGVMCVSMLIVTALWAGFSLDYATTRDIYFAFAIGHVLAEAPFLIKML